MSAFTPSQKVVIAQWAASNMPQLADVFAVILKQAQREIEPPQAAESDDCGGCNKCKDCIKWSEFELCPVCSELTFVAGEGCSECGFGGECPVCGYDKARGLHDVQIDVDRIICKDEYGHKISEG